MAAFTQMIDMAKSPEEVKKDVGQEAAPGWPLTTQVYPYGLCIRLEDDTLEKLGLGNEMPSVGDMIHLCAMAKVTSVSENEMEDGNGGKKSRRCIELQITHLATESEDDENDVAMERQKARQGRFYGGDKAA